jgi:MATE family multidrug resistance protein
MQFVNITAYALDGFAFAAEVLVAQSVGARDITALRRSVWLAAVWSVLGAVLLALAFAVMGGPLVDLMARVPAVQTEARAFLPYMVAVPLLGVLAWVMDGVFIGATRGADMRNMTALSAALYFASLTVLLPAFGNHGLWIALAGSFVLRGVTLALRYPALERSLTAA